jgi:hypothetical protein
MMDIAAVVHMKETVVGTAERTMIIDDFDNHSRRKSEVGQNPKPARRLV